MTSKSRIQKKYEIKVYLKLVQLDQHKKQNRRNIRNTKRT